AMLDGDAPLDDIIAAVTESPYTRLPVYRESPDEIIGYIHTRDIAASVSGAKPLTSVDELLRPLVMVPESVTADRLLRSLRESGTQQAMVVDEFGSIAGLVTLEDILAELLGEFPDEYKGGQPQPERLASGRVRLPGMLPLDDATAWTGVRWEGHSN